MMKSTRTLFLLVAAAAIGLLGFALYLQIHLQMFPCPLCILQRYGFAAVALFCLVAAFLPPQAQRVGAGLGMLSALAGGGVAVWHLWIKAHPTASCGIDPMETSLNRIFTADLLPILFKADGFCSTEYDPILGLSIPQWSFVWFLAFTLVLGWVALRRSR